MAERQIPDPSISGTSRQAARTDRRRGAVASRNARAFSSSTRSRARSCSLNARSWRGHHVRRCPAKPPVRPTGQVRDDLHRRRPGPDDTDPFPARHDIRMPLAVCTTVPEKPSSPPINGNAWSDSRLTASTSIRARTRPLPVTEDHWCRRRVPPRIDQLATGLMNGVLVPPSTVRCTVIPHLAGTTPPNRQADETRTNTDAPGCRRRYPGTHCRAMPPTASAR